MEIGCRWGKIANEHIRIGSHSYEKVKTFKYLGSLVTNKNFVQEDIKCRLKAGNSCYYSVHTLLSLKTFKYLGSLLANQNSIQEDIKCRLKAENSCYYSVQTLLSSRILSKNLKIKIYINQLPVVLYGCET